MKERAALPDWPRMMRIELAAQYLGIGESVFRALGIVPQNIGAAVVYDRRSLDLFADRLSGQPLSDEDVALASAEQERAFLARRRGG